MTKKSRSRRSKTRARGRKAWIVGALFVAVVGVAAGLSGLDLLGRALKPDRTVTTAAIAPSKKVDIVAMPARMAAPAAKPVVQRTPERSRLNAAVAPRPRLGLTGGVTPAAKAVARPAVALNGKGAISSAGLAPARKPQEGDCACPYDLMLDGSACGPRSTYLTPGREKPICYR
jgi:hypothetical protein